MTADAHDATVDVSRIRTAGIAGVIMPVMFFGIVALLTWLEYDFLKAQGMSLLQAYDAEIPWPSGLARGPWGILQTLNFLALGALAAVFLRGIRTQFHRGWAARIATFFLGLYAFDGILNAMRVDLSGENTIWGLAHLIGFGLINLCILIGVPAAGLALRRNPDWAGLWKVSLAWPILLIGAFVFADLVVPGALGFAPALLVLTGWFALAGRRLLVISRRAG